MAWEIEFYEDDEGRQPARRFLEALSPAKRAAMIAAIEMVLEARGLDVCSTEYGRPLGQGLFEFRIRHDEKTIRNKHSDQSATSRQTRAEPVLLRMFCHAYGRHVILLLGGYDKGDDPSNRRQDREIAQARKNLRSFRLKQRRDVTGARRRK